MAYIEMRHCFKRYASGESEIIANNDVSLRLKGRISYYSRGFGFRGNQLSSIS